MDTRQSIAIGHDRDMRHTVSCIEAMVSISVNSGTFDSGTVRTVTLNTVTLSNVKVK